MVKSNRKTYRNIIIIMIALITIVCFYINYKLTSPESRIMQQFDVDISNLKYSIDSEEEKWYPNGDGFYYVKLSFNEHIESLKTNDFKNLPAREHLPNNRFLAEISEIESGLYQFEYLDINERDYRILVIDKKNKKLIMYYEIM